MEFTVPTDLVHASFFFVDIVGLSNPELSTSTQTTKIKSLNEMIKNCNAFSSVSPKDKLVLPTGDGMAIGFLHGLESPLNLAKELQSEIHHYNEDKLEEDQILVRIGLHGGNVFVVDDVLGNKNFWGPGIIIARRVMDMGDANHILMTSSMAESLLEISEDYDNIIFPLHDYQIKHGDVILIYSVHGDTFGNPARPQKGLHSKPKILEEFHEMKKTISYRNVEVKLRLKNTKLNSLENSRTYYIENNSDEPIFEVINGIITIVEKTFFDLNVRAFDENNIDLKIKSINVDSPLRKEFTIKLEKPVFKGDFGRSYTVLYDVEQPEGFYENMFLINTRKLEVSFTFLTGEDIKTPKLFIIRHQNRDKKLVERIPQKREGISTTIKWVIDEGIFEKDMIRLEWK